MERMIWLLCPVCGNKTRLKVRQDTELINFPLYCPKCKQETLVNVKNTQLSVIRLNMLIVISHNLWSKKAFAPIRDFALMSMNTQII